MTSERSPIAAVLLAVALITMVAGAQHVWVINSSHCISGGNCLQLPTDVDCDCENNATSASGTCTLSY
jgi:hypothetical protein